MRKYLKPVDDEAEQVERGGSDRQSGQKTAWQCLAAREIRD